MDQRVIELARRLQGASWNRPDNDKTWVLAALASHFRLMAAARPMERRTPAP